MHVGAEAGMRALARCARIISGEQAAAAHMAPALKPRSAMSSLVSSARMR
jgi:hypothetical protein